MEPLQTWWATELYPMRERDQFGVSGEFEVVLATDAQATIAALQAEVHGLKRDAGLDCGDHSCLYAVTKTGMRTNGGCRCNPKRLKEDLERSRKACDELQAHLTQRTAELEAAKRLATNAQWQIDYVLDEAKKAFDLKGHYTPSDLVDCALRPAASMLKERDELKAELERVRALIKALPKVEGDWTVSCALAVTVVTGGIVRDISEVVAAIVQHRQGMEG